MQEDEKNEDEENVEYPRMPSKSEYRRITLDMSSYEKTLKEFLDNKQRQWEKVKQNQENDIKIKHLFPNLEFFSLYIITFKAKEFTSRW